MDNLKDVYNTPQFIGGLSAGILCTFLTSGTTFSNEFLTDIEIRTTIAIIAGILVYLLIYLNQGH